MPKQMKGSKPHWVTLASRVFWIYQPKSAADGEINLTSHNHEYVLMTGVTFQALPRLGVTFRYAGLGRGGNLLKERVIWDRSFDAHISITDEQKYLPAFSIGLRISLVQAGIPLNTSSRRSVVILNLQQVLALVACPQARIHFLIHLVCSLHDLIIVIVAMEEEEH